MLEDVVDPVQDPVEDLVWFTGEFYLKKFREIDFTKKIAIYQFANFALINASIF